MARAAVGQFTQGKRQPVWCRHHSEGELTGNDLSINFGTNGITSLLTETGVSGTGKATSSFGDGWYALGIDTTGGDGPVFWEPFFRLFGSATGDTTVTGPYSTAGTEPTWSTTRRRIGDAAECRRRRQRGCQ